MSEPSTASTTETRFEVVATFLLAVAALAAAWSGYQASLWDGIQSSDYSKASGLRTGAAQQHTAANQERLADLGLFENYMNATERGEIELAAFYRQRFPPDFHVAFEAWSALDPLNNPDAPRSPLAMSEYHLEAEANAARLTADADATFEAGEEANNISDRYVLTTLFFASVLFLAAVSERLQVVRLRATLLGVAIVLMLVGFGVTFTEPVTGG